jgi:hypothetical protein
MEMKRPSFQFYPSDWLRDTALRSCSIGARGLWIDMICFMHEGNPYGTLKVGNKVILPVNLAAMVGATLPEVEGWLIELESAHVFDRGDEGEIMSRRMIRDENLRNVRAAGGKKGGNPALMVNGKDNPKVNLEDKQKPTPSSSSSPSSSSPIIPPNPQRGMTRPKRNRLNPKHERVTENTPAMIQINDWFGRKADTLWTIEQARILELINPSEAVLNGMGNFYLADETPETPLYRRTTLTTLLNNWDDELDKARAYSRKQNQ